MLTKRAVLLAKIESTYNTDPTPTGLADAVLASNVAWSLAGARMNERPAMRNTLGQLKQLFGGALLQMSFDVEVKGSGTAGTAPEIGPLLRACGLNETIVASTSVTYAPVSTAIESCTMYLYEDGKLYKMTGCRGNVSGNLETGQAGKLSFTLTGHYSGPTDVSVASPTYDSTVPVATLSGGFAADSYAAVINALAFDLGNSVVTPPSFNAADGFGDIIISGRDVAGSIDPEDVLIATKDFMAAYKAGTVMSIATGVIGSTAGNRYQLTFGYSTYRDLAPGDRDGIRTYELAFGAAESSGDDELSLAFT